MSCGHSILSLRYRIAKKFPEQKLPDNNHDLFSPIFLIIIFFDLHLPPNRKLMASKFKIHFIRPVRNFFVYHFIRSILYIGPLMPRRLLLVWHGFLGRSVFTLSSRLRNSIVSNLSLAYGSKKNREENIETGKNLLELLAKTLTDYALFWRMKKREDFLRYFDLEGEEYLKEAYSKGKGVICLVPHTVGWEFSAIMPPVLGYTTFAVSSKIRNPALNRLMIELRESRGMRNITRKRCFDLLVEGLKNKGECLILMIDQDSMAMRGEFLTFFGQRAYTPIGSSRLALETDAPILPMFTVRGKDNKYLFKILPEIPFSNTGDMERDIMVNTQRHNDAIEDIVRQYPEQWLWLHNRWATTPESLNEYLVNKRKEKEQAQQVSSHKQ